MVIVDVVHKTKKAPDLEITTSQKPVWSSFKDTCVTHTGHKQCQKNLIHHISPKTSFHELFSDIWYLYGLSKFFRWVSTLNLNVFMLFFHLIKDWPMLHAHDFLYINVLQIKRQPTFVKKNLHNSPTEKNWCSKLHTLFARITQSSLIFHITL